MADSRLTDEARQWIGRTYPERAFVVTRDSVRRFAYATGETDATHFDSEVARRAGFRGVVAPPMYYVVIRTYPFHTVPLVELGRDGIPEEDLPPIAFTRGVAGESAAEWHGEIVAGDTIIAAKTLTNLYEKEGRSGSLVFVEFEFEFRQEAGELAVRERLTRVLR